VAAILRRILAAALRENASMRNRYEIINWLSSNHLNEARDKQG